MLSSFRQTVLQNNRSYTASSSDNIRMIKENIGRISQRRVRRIQERQKHWATNTLWLGITEDYVIEGYGSINWFIYWL